MKLLLIFVAFLASSSSAMDGGGGDMELPSKEEMMDMLAPRLLDVLMKFKYTCIMEKMMSGEAEECGLCPHVKCAMCVGEDTAMGMKIGAAMEACGICMDDPMETEGEVAARMMMEPTEEEKAAMMECAMNKMEQKKCMLTHMGWLDENCEECRETIAADMGSTLIGEKLMGAEECCHDFAMSLTADCVADLEGCPFEMLADQMHGDDEDCDCDMQEEEMRARPNRAQKNARRANRKARQMRKAMRKARRQARRAVRMENAVVLEMTRGMTYFGCLKKSFDEACMCTANERLACMMCPEEEAAAAEP